MKNNPFDMRKLIALLILLTPLQTVAQSLSMDSCKYFAELVNAERAKRFKKELVYQESSQPKLDKSAMQLFYIFKHRVTEKNCAEVICYSHKFSRMFTMFMNSPKHRKILMGRSKSISVGIFRKDGIYYLCARTY